MGISSFRFFQMQDWIFLSSMNLFSYWVPYQIMDTYQLKWTYGT